MDKYLLVILMFMMVSIPIAFFDPTTGLLREQPNIPLFYGAIAGIIIIVLYSSYKERKERKELNRKRRQSKK